MGGPNAFALLEESGAGWLRMPLKWAQFETAERRLQVAAWAQGFRAQCPGVKLLVTSRCWLGGEQATPMPDVAAYCADLEVLQDLIRAEAWQIENEIDGHSWWAGSIDQYASLLDAAYDALHESTLVLCAGLTSEGTMAAWKYMQHLIELPPAAVLQIEAIKTLLATTRYDVADIHVYDLASTAAVRVKWFLQHTAGRPVWVTECGGPDVRVEPYSEAAQAIDVRVRMDSILSVAQKAFWLGLSESTQQGDTYNQLGLVDLTGRKKPAFDTFRALTGG
jgi:hypothetical protein